MKLIKFLNQEGTTLLSDPINPTILTLLVKSEHSISQLAAELNLPTLKLWRRMQKLANANLVEVTKTEKVGNIEKKLYRATATCFAPQQFFNFKPKDANLVVAFEIYSNIQNSMINKILELGDVPVDVEAVDFSLYANMQAFAKVCSEPEAQTKILELKQKLEKFKEKSSLKKRGD